MKHCSDVALKHCSDSWMQEGNRYHTHVTHKNFKGKVLGYVTPWYVALKRYSWLRLLALHTIVPAVDAAVAYVGSGRLGHTAVFPLPSSCCAPESATAEAGAAAINQSTVAGLH